MSTAKVSIVIPTYNRYDSLRLCLKSVQEQTYDNWECIVVDDHSTDLTVDYVRNISNSDSRFIVVVNEGKKGAQGARNTGIKVASGDFIAFLDSDNTFFPTKLFECLKAAEHNPTVQVISSFSSIINSKREETGVFNWLSSGQCHQQILKLESYVDFSQTFVCNSLLHKIGFLDEDCPSFQEWETHIRLSLSGAKYYTIPKLLNTYYVDSSADRISNNKLREIAGWLYVLEKHKLLWRKNSLRITYFKLILRGIRMSLNLKSNRTTMMAKFSGLLFSF